MRTSLARCLLFVLLGIFSAWLAASTKGSKETGSRFPLSDIRPVQDVFVPISPSAVKLSGFLGKRCSTNIDGWLLKRNEDSLLNCYTHRPGSYGWEGEHVGKWIYAAALAWSNSRNPELRAKLDRVVDGLLKTQLSDGYLGTYRMGFHWSMRKGEQWDVWIHRYNLLGLLTYFQATGNKKALDAATKIGDLLVGTFGPRSKLNINKRGVHRGMASGSVLEPMVLLYTITHDVRYLQFGLFIVQQWETPGGPKLVSDLTKGTSVSSTANGKAYEMLSCLIGLCELYRATGQNHFLVPVLNAWSDIKQNQVYLTGGGSQGEFWKKKGQICYDSCRGFAEICVTVEWLRLNEQLLRLTGKVRFADEIETICYNHLAAAQYPDGTAWSYFTDLKGRKSFSKKQTCCSSSGPMGWASVSQYAYMMSKDGIVINLFSTSSADLVLPTGDSVTISQVTDYPATAQQNFTISVSTPVNFTLYLRVPTWTHSDDEHPSDEYLQVKRHWSGNTLLQHGTDIPVRLQKITKSATEDYASVIRGPEVMVVDSQYNPSLASLRLEHGMSTLTLIKRKIGKDDQTVYSVRGIRHSGNSMNEPAEIFLSPFSSSGMEGSPYSVWIPIARHISPTETENKR